MQIRETDSVEQGLIPASSAPVVVNSTLACAASAPEGAIQEIEMTDISSSEAN